MATKKTQRKSGTRRRRGKSVSRIFSGKGYMIIILIITVASGIWGYCSVKSDSGNQKIITSTAQTAAPHYDGLELARHSSSAPHGSIIRLQYTGFTMDFNNSNRTPDWVGWELLADETDGPVKRSNKFWEDSSIEFSPTPDDYRNSGFDKGHLCPSADQKWSEDAMHDCFVMTNMAPQDPSLNSGAWRTLETKERLWAKRDSAIVIVAGPIYTDSDRKRIGDSGVRVPSAFFRVLLAPYTEYPRAIGFVYPNMHSPGNMADYSMSVDEVEKITGLDFFYNLPDDIEEKVERSASFKEWNRK